VMTQSSALRKKSAKRNYGAGFNPPLFISAQRQAHPPRTKHERQ